MIFLQGDCRGELTELITISVIARYKTGQLVPPEKRIDDLTRIVGAADAEVKMKQIRAQRK